MGEFPIIIIGAGPAGLMAAQDLAEKGYQVHIYEQNKAAARKFLVAGHGGFNLTHSEDLETFITRYDKDTLHPIIRAFDNKKTIQWLHQLGIDTYVGSSGKIFPAKHIKPIQVLHAWLEKLVQLGVKIHYEHTFHTFEDTTVTISNKGEHLLIPFSKLILALGGGSWQKTGSNAKWIPILANKNIKILDLQAANSGYNTKDNFQHLAGQILKNIEVSFNDIRKKGELVFTQYGIEGSSIYYLNRFTRTTAFPLTIYLDLKPSLSITHILQGLQSNSQTSKTLKEKLNLNTTALGLLKKLSKERYTDPHLLSRLIKAYPIVVTGLRPIDEVISTAGGISMDELHHSLALQKYPNVYCIGEMLDWEAPTGGYLLQACFSMGAWVAQDISNILPKH